MKSVKLNFRISRRGGKYLIILITFLLSFSFVSAFGNASYAKAPTVKPNTAVVQDGSSNLKRRIGDSKNVQPIGKGSEFNAPNRSLLVPSAKGSFASFGFKVLNKPLLNPNNLVVAGSGAEYVFPCTARVSWIKSARIVVGFESGNRAGQCVQGVKVTPKGERVASSNLINQSSFIATTGLTEESGIKGLVKATEKAMSEDVSDEIDDVGVVTHYCNAVAESGSGSGFHYSQSWDVFSPDDPCEKAIQQCLDESSSSDKKLGCRIASVGSWSSKIPEEKVIASVRFNTDPPILKSQILKVSEIDDQINQWKKESKDSLKTNFLLDISNVEDSIYRPASDKPTLSEIVNAEGKVAIRAMDGDLFVRSAGTEGDLRVKESFEYIYNLSEPNQDKVQKIANYKEEFTKPPLSIYLEQDWKTDPPVTEKIRYHSEAPTRIPASAWKLQEHLSDLNPVKKISFAMPPSWKRWAEGNLPNEAAGTTGVLSSDRTVDYALSENLGLFWISTLGNLRSPNYNGEYKVGPSLETCGLNEVPAAAFCIFRDSQKVVFQESVNTSLDALVDKIVESFSNFPQKLRDGGYGDRATTVTVQQLSRRNVKLASSEAVELRLLISGTLNIENQDRKVDFGKINTTAYLLKKDKEFVVLNFSTRPENDMPSNAKETGLFEQIAQTFDWSSIEQISAPPY